MAAENTHVETASAEPAAAVRPRSEAQLAASRLNGGRSRGPRSAAGKAAASRNALRHGFFAAVHVVLPEEDAEAFALMRRELARERGVEGLGEEGLAHSLATASLQQLRLERMQRDLCAAYTTTPMGPLADAEGRQRAALLLRWQARVEAQHYRASAELRRCQKERGAATARYADALRDGCERNAELYRARIARLEHELGRAAAAVTAEAEPPAVPNDPDGPVVRNEPEPTMPVPLRAGHAPAAAAFATPLRSPAAALFAERLRRKLSGESIDDDEEELAVSG